MSLGSSNAATNDAPAVASSTLVTTVVQEEVKPDSAHLKLVRFLADAYSASKLSMRAGDNDDDPMLYAPRYTAAEAGGHFTHSYTAKTTLSAFVARAVSPKEKYPEQWGWMYSRRLMRCAAVESLRVIIRNNGGEAPLHKKNRHMLAFRNGMYVTPTDRFYRWANDAEMLELGQLTAAANNASGYQLCAAKYHDLDFAVPDAESEGAADFDWYPSLETPVFQKMLDDQCLSEEVARWFYVMMGRMLFDVKEKDEWDVQLGLTGLAGTGKSTIVRLLMSIFEHKDSVVINHGDSGVESVPDGCMNWFALGVNKDLLLDKNVWLSMVRGEQVKYGGAPGKSKVWTSPGMLESNVGLRPDGTAARHIMEIRFPQIIVEKDPAIFPKLEAELPLFIRKINKAYQAACIEVGKRPVWDVAPDYFQPPRNIVKKRKAAGASDAAADAAAAVVAPPPSKKVCT